MTAPLNPPLGSFWTATHAVHRLFQCLDDGHNDKAAALFAPDGVWLRQGERLTGPAAVLQALQARPAGLVTRHLVSNLVLDTTEHGIDARYYVTVFADPGPVQGVPVLTAPHSLFVCEDRLVPVGQAWLFSERKPRLVFKQA